MGGCKAGAEYAVSMASDVVKLLSKNNLRLVPGLSQFARARSGLPANRALTVAQTGSRLVEIGESVEGLVVCRRVQIQGADWR